MGNQDFSRSRRVGDQLGRELATILLEDLDDPRLRGVTLSRVDVSRDLRSATVLVTLPAGADSHEALRALARATGRLRKRLSARVRLKYMPSLRFEYDSTLDRVDRIDRLLRGETSEDD